MDPLDYAIGQTMGLFTGVLRLIPVVLGLLLKILPFALAVALAVALCAVSGAVCLAWGAVGMCVNVVRRRNRRYGIREVADTTKVDILSSRVFVRFWGESHLCRNRHPGDEVPPRRQLDPMQLFIPAQWIRGMFALPGLVARGCVDVGIFAGILAAMPLRVFLTVGGRQ